MDSSKGNHSARNYGLDVQEAKLIGGHAFKWPEWLEVALAFFSLVILQPCAERASTWQTPRPHEVRCSGCIDRQVFLS